MSVCLCFISRKERISPEDAARDRDEHPQTKHKVPAPPQPVLGRVLHVRAQAGVVRRSRDVARRGAGRQRRGRAAVDAQHPAGQPVSVPHRLAHQEEPARTCYGMVKKNFTPY